MVDPQPQGGGESDDGVVDAPSLRRNPSATQYLCGAGTDRLFAIAKQASLLALEVEILFHTLDLWR